MTAITQTEHTTKYARQVLGALPGVQGAFIASGHVEWGVLLAPGTGLWMSQLICDGTAELDLSAFRPDRPSVDKPRQAAGSKRLALTG